VSFVNGHRERWGVEPICTALQVAPSTYYAAASRQPSARQLGDARLKTEIARVHRDNFGVYGIEKVWRQLNREGHKVGRDRAARLMDDMGLSGVVRGKRKRTTVPAEVSARPADLVERNFSAVAPNQLWVADVTYVSTWSGFCYVAFVTDVFSGFIVGWRVSTSLHTELALDALEMAIWRRQRLDLTGLIHHSDRGVQYLSIRYTERLAEVGAMNSVGSKGDSYDNALAESINGLYKAEVIRNTGPWRSLEQVELATAAWSIGGTIAVSTAPSKTCHRASTRRTTITNAPPTRPRDPKPLNLQKTQGDSVGRAISADLERDLVFVRISSPRPNYEGSKRRIDIAPHAAATQNAPASAIAPASSQATNPRDNNPMSARSPEARLPSQRRSTSV
jgi:putative transposase